ncbi:TIGR02449 family protein [Kangiella sp. HZ709]|uniref:TIGR02449 family protein n=1 Tax=Kangiella sp. HZ709 TaxID=2666328 RepID=UPI001D0D8896|nr:TIGR02449 family protein [Kangiella sp. HZ709]
MNMVNPQNQLELLESQVDSLLLQFEKINSENSDLRSQINHMRNEKQQLINKNESARQQIDLMIKRLKSM